MFATAVSGGAGTVLCVPGVIAVLPGQRSTEGAEHVVQGPGDHHVVVRAHDERDSHGRQADPWGASSSLVCQIQICTEAVIARRILNLN